nr:ribonuclease D [Gammaproteobacteria bacterium]
MRPCEEGLPHFRSPTFITHNEALAKACAQWTSCEALALDTEFARARTYYPRVGLIQVFDGETVYLIDPLALSRLDPFFDVLRERSVLKILHASSEDLEVFYHLGRTLPRPLFDTQLAAPFAGYGYAPGYQRLVSQMLSVKLPKAETRSSWLQRPLTPSQVMYAAQDVIYLLPLYQMLQQRLAENGRECWVYQEVEKLLDARRFHRTGHSSYRRMPQAWQLDPRGLEVLRRLCVWRDEQARTRDLPRGFILQDAVLLEIARKRPITSLALKSIHGVPVAAVSRLGDTLVSLIQGALSVSENELPVPLPNPTAARAHAALMSKLKLIVSKKAAELDMPPQVLAHSRLIESLVRHAKTEGSDELPREFQGWRKDVVGDALLATLRHSSEAVPTA